MVHQVDRHVGARIRQRRLSMAMTQQALAQKLGITFQQVQKYEQGNNRVSASRLWEMTQALQIDICHFFEGLEHPPRAAHPGAAQDMPSPAARSAPPMHCSGGPGLSLRGDRLPDLPPDMLVNREAATLLRSFAAIPAQKRARLLELARTLTEN